MPEHCEIRSIAAVNLYKDESFKEPEQKVGQNVEKVRILSKWHVFFSIRPFFGFV